MKQIFLLLLVSIIATQNESLASPAKENPVDTGALGDVINKLLAGLGVGDFKEGAISEVKTNIIKAIDELLDEKKKTVGSQIKKNKACKLSLIKTYWGRIIKQCQTLQDDVDSKDDTTCKAKTAKTLALMGKSSESVNTAIARLKGDCTSKCTKIFTLISDLLDKLNALINKLNLALDSDKKDKKKVLNLAGIGR